MIKIQPTNPINFGVYKGKKSTTYGIKETGMVNGKKLDVYTAYENGKIKHKLYYLYDSAGNWIKSKLKYFDENGLQKQIRSKTK